MNVSANCRRVLTEFSLMDFMLHGLPSFLSANSSHPHYIQNEAAFLAVLVPIMSRGRDRNMVDDLELNQAVARIWGANVEANLVGAFCQRREH